MANQNKEDGKTPAELPHGDHLPATHDHHGRFPTKAELDPFVRKEVATAAATDLAFVAYERHLERTALHHAFHENDTHPSPSPDFRALVLKQFISVDDARKILVSLRNLRINHRDFDKADQGRFNNALKLAHQAGAYEPLAAVHTDMKTHRMHSMSGAVGTQRFLPWHRLYVLECENLLRTYEPSLRIPYWDYANDRTRPDWVWHPPSVNRHTPGNGASLPTQGAVDSIEQNVSYTDFTFGLEFDAHNDVHNWCNGTITDPATAAYDPIFWLLHANVDRLWNTWQMKHNGRPLLKAMDWILDPYSIPASDVDSILQLGYWYG